MLFQSNRLVAMGCRQMSQRTSGTASNAWRYGMIGLGVSGVGGLAYSLRYALSPDSDSNIRRAAVWPQYVKDRLQGTFGYCLSGIGFTTAGALAALRSQTAMRFFGSGSIGSFIGCMVLMMGSGYACRSIPFDGSVLGSKAALYYLHMGIVGAIISPIVSIGGPVCLRAGAATLAIMSGLALTGMVAPSDAYVKMYGPVNAGCFLMLGACLVSFVAPPMGAMRLGLESFIVLGGLALFSAKGFMDLQKAASQAQQPGAYDPINNALHITMDAVQIFIRLVMLMSGSKRK